jgi:hypothetical protein
VQDIRLCDRENKSETHLFLLASFPNAPIFLIIILAEETVDPIEMLSVDALRMLNKLRFPFPALPFNGSMKLGAKLELLGRRWPNPGCDCDPVGCWDC